MRRIPALGALVATFSTTSPALAENDSWEIYGFDEGVFGADQHTSISAKQSRLGATR